MRIIQKSSTKWIMLLFLWLSTLIQAFADTSFCENGFTYTIMKDNSSLSLTRYQATSKTDWSQPFHISASVTHEGKSYPVKRIETKAFKDVTEIQVMVIDEGIENIGNYAFECCTNLKSISIPSTVESIGEGLFGSCYNLTSIIVDQNNECYDSREESNAIIDSDNDELIVACSTTKIPASVKSIGDFAFYHCNVMQHLIIPEGVETIGSNVFFGCSSLESVTLPGSLTEIGFNAFCGCNSLSSIIIPKNVLKIGDYNIFSGCYNLTSIVVDGSNPNYDSRSNCNGIVRKSDSELIATCRSTSIGSDITSLGKYCFEGTIIHSVYIPKNIVSISENAFEGCNEIDEIDVAAENPNFSSPKGSNALLSKDGKTLLVGFRTTAIPKSVETIGSNAFTGRFQKLVLRIPESVKTIGMFAFCGCNAICEVILPKSLQSIGSYAFSNCVNLSVVQLLAPVTIESHLFSKCYSLSAVNLPEGIEEIGSYAFAECKNLEHIAIPSSVKSIDKTAFEDCPILEKK